MTFSKNNVITKHSNSHHKNCIRKPPLSDLFFTSLFMMAMNGNVDLTL